MEWAEVVLTKDWWWSLSYVARRGLSKRASPLHESSINIPEFGEGRSRKYWNSMLNKTIALYSRSYSKYLFYCDCLWCFYLPDSVDYEFVFLIFYQCLESWIISRSQMLTSTSLPNSNLSLCHKTQNVTGKSLRQKNSFSWHGVLKLSSSNLVENIWGIKKEFDFGFFFFLRCEK